jgi:hypothetical protein
MQDVWCLRERMMQKNTAMLDAARMLQRSLDV